MAAEQWSLDGSPPERHHPNNLPRRLVDVDGVVITSIWLGYCNSGESVGDCRWCGGPLYAERPMGVSHNRTDYSALCRNRDCGREVVFPNGRTGKWDDAQKRGRRRPLSRDLVQAAKTASRGGDDS